MIIIFYDSQSEKLNDFKQLRVKYGTCRSEDGAYDGTGRNGQPKYKKIVRIGMMTEMGDIEISEWEAMARELVHRHKEEEIYQKLLIEATFKYMNPKEKEIHALSLHMSRIFENHEWVHYKNFNGIPEENMKGGI